MCFSRYIIEFANLGISDIITELLRYTNKIAIISGRMACRGISFVNNDYTKHITDMIYVPSHTSHLTRNVQDMRIYGNFPQDGIKLNLYVDEDMYINDIGNFIKLQNNLLKGKIGEVLNTNVNCRQAIFDYEFNPDNVPRKKLDRVGLIKGIKFMPEGKWGFPTYITDINSCISKLVKKYPNFELKIYSIADKFIIPNGENFIAPQIGSIEQAYYKKLFTQDSYFKRGLEKFGKENFDNSFELKGNPNTVYIYPTFRNA